VTSIFTYRLNEAGLITNLRGYWKLSDMSFSQPE
jgi:steroid delta-isomerase